MKKFIFLLALITGLSAQTGMTVMGGMNLSAIKYNDSDLADAVDVSSSIGLCVGAEKIIGPMILGGAFVQRGSKLEAFGDKVTMTFNYLSAYGLYHYPIQETLSIIGGLQFGSSLGGKFQNEESEDIESDELNLDFGLLLGANYMFQSNMGVRGFYYLGLADVAADAESSSDNFKNRGFGFALLYKM